MSESTILKQATRIVTDENGMPIVQVPLAIWQALLAKIESHPPQREQIKALLAQWESEPDDTSPAWWDEFEAFINEEVLT